jgi:hypothetical protein
VIIESEDCSLDGGETSTAPKIASCPSASCTLEGGGDAVCTPIFVSCVTTGPEPGPE